MRQLALESSLKRKQNFPLGYYTLLNMTFCHITNTKHFTNIEKTLQYSKKKKNSVIAKNDLGWQRVEMHHSFRENVLRWGREAGRWGRAKRQKLHPKCVVGRRPGVQFDGPPPPHPGLPLVRSRTGRPRYLLGAPR